MELLILIISLIGWKVSGIEFMSLFFYISLAFSIRKNLTN